MKRKAFFVLMALALVVGLSIPMAVPAMAATMTVSSDTSVQIAGVYNKAGGVSNYVDLSSSPLSAVRAWEPAPYPTTYPVEPGEATDSTWDNGVNWFEDNGSSADWIWETHRAEDPALYNIANPLYDADAARYGRVVLFETTFNIPGNPTSATLHIAADNGYEAWVNSGTHYMSPTVVGGPGWENSNLHEGNLTTSGWQSYGTHVISASDLVNGSNTLYILAGNEYFGTDDGNSPVPPTQPAPYAQYNPGAAIFQLDIEYEEFVPAPEIELTKTGNETAHEGEIITYFYAGNNTGNIPFWGGNITVSDSLGIEVEPVLENDGNVTGDTDKNGWLDPGEVWLFTGNYTVPCFTLGPVENTGNITATFGDEEEISATDDWSVDILHNPDIEVTKEGPAPVGYFTSLNAHYEYTVTNTGDACLDDVALIDDMVGTPNQTGDGDGDEYLSPGEVWTYEADFLLECTGNTTTVFSNTATGNGTDVEGTVVEDFACWNVVVFQWMPRTIGYWGNWDNHWSLDCMTQLVAAVNGNSTYFEGLITADVHTILLAADQTGKMTVAKATALLKKQLLATWLNVVSYMGATDANENTCGSLDAAMDPNATVYFETGSSMTVQALLNRIEYNLTTGSASFGIDGRLKAKDILDKMNNAENNDYYMFMDPEFEAGECNEAPLYNSPAYTANTCPFGADDTSGPIYGFVIINANPGSDVKVHVMLEGATPGATYDIWVNQYDGACPLPSPTAPGALTTDGDGNGYAFVTVARVPLATKFWVSAVGGGQVLRSTIALDLN